MLHQIGEGVLGPVFRTYDPERDRLVAVKVFRLDITPEQARTLADCLNRMAEIGLSEPGLVTPLMAGVEETVAYLAQEYVAAESLDVAMRHYAPSAIDRAAPFVSQLAGAIDGARAAGVLHGALHPRDIFVTPDSAQATGFGVVPALEEVGLRGPIRRPYTAPERVGETEWGPGADIFSLAVIAYELLTGKRPAGTGADAARELREHSPSSSSPELERLFASALSERPEDRPRTAHEFASVFEALGSGTGVGAGVGAGTAAEAPPLPPVPEPTVLIEPPTVRIEPTVEAKDEPLVQVDDAAADEAWDVASQEPVAWTGGAEEAAGQTKGADSPPEEAVSPTDESDSGSFELGDLPAEDALEVPAADAGPAPIVAPVVPSPESESADVASVSPPDVEQAPVESAPGQPGAPVEEGEEDELAVWLASVEIAEGRRPLRRPELEEVDRLLSAPEASEALTEPSEPEAEPASQPRRSLFDTGPVVMPEPPTSETDVTAAPEPPEAPVSTAPSPPRDEPKPDRGTEADQAAADVSPMFQAADPSAALAPPSGPSRPEDESAPAATTSRSRSFLSVTESGDRFGGGGSRTGSLLSEDEGIDEEMEAELSQAAPPKRTPILPFALALILGILVAFVAGYGLGSRQPASAPTGSAGTPPPAPVAAPAETPPAVEPADRAPVAPLVAEESPEPAPVAESVAEPSPPPAPAPDPVQAPPPVVDAPGLLAEAPAADVPATAPATAPAAVGRLLIRSNPPGAQVVVNDRAAGITPLAMGDLPFGDYMIRISRAGYRIELLSVSITGGEPVAALELELIESGGTPTRPAPSAVQPVTPPVGADPGTVIVDSRPGGAEVYVDGRLVGATPLILVDVPPGSHTIRLVRTGYREVTTTVDVVAGQEARVAASLEVLP